MLRAAARDPDPEVRAIFVRSWASRFLDDSADMMVADSSPELRREAAVVSQSAFLLAHASVARIDLGHACSRFLRIADALMTAACDDADPHVRAEAAHMLLFLSRDAGVAQVADRTAQRQAIVDHLA